MEHARADFSGRRDPIKFWSTDAICIPMAFAVDVLRSSKLQNQRGRAANHYRMNRPAG